MGSRDPYAEVGLAARHVLVEAARASPALRSRSWRVLAAVVAYTATYSRHEDHVAHEELGTAAGFDMADEHHRRNFARELRDLEQRGLVVYQPGRSPAGGSRLASRIGLPRPPVGADPLSALSTPGRDRPPVREAYPRSEPARTPGRSRHGPPVGADPPPEKYPEESPEARVGARADTDNGQAARWGEDDNGWSRIVDRLRGPVRRRLDDEPAADRRALDEALAGAVASGVRAPRPEVLWDQPTSLDHRGIRSVSKTLAKRIRGHVAEATPARTA